MNEEQKTALLELAANNVSFRVISDCDQFWIGIGDTIPKYLQVNNRLEYDAFIKEPYGTKGRFQYTHKATFLDKTEASKWLTQN